MSSMIRLAIAGIGLIGKRHIESIAHVKNVEVSAIVDTDESAGSYALALGIPWYQSLSEMFAKESPDGVILATPNQLHVEHGLECVAHNCPMLIEKPLATCAKEAAGLVKSAGKAGVPILVGHHRRHNPLIKKAKELIDEGKLGDIRSVHGNCWLFKPDDYFEIAPWRKLKGAGPISVNLVHDIDLIRYLCGDVISVQAQMSPSIRGFENEDVAAALLTFENGAIGTITVSDTIVAPWSWELTAGENPAYPSTAESCYLLGGTHGSLSLPDLKLWENKETRGWWQPISATNVPSEASDPLINQIEQFVVVITGKEEPLVSGEEGLKTLRVIESIQQSASTGEAIKLNYQLNDQLLDVANCV